MFSNECGPYDRVHTLCMNMYESNNWWSVYSAGPEPTAAPSVFRQPIVSMSLLYVSFYHLKYYCLTSFIKQFHSLMVTFREIMTKRQHCFNVLITILFNVRWNRNQIKFKFSINHTRCNARNATQKACFKLKLFCVLSSECAC